MSSSQQAQEYLQRYLQQEIRQQRGGQYNATQDLANRGWGPTGLASPPANLPDKQDQEKRGIYDASICFMSPQRTSDDLANGEITWYIPQINLNNSVVNCIQIQINSFTIPALYDINAIHEQFIGRRVYVEIAQLPGSTGVRCSDGSRFHFECSVTYPSQEYALLEPLGGPVILKAPLPSLDEMTLRLYQRNQYSPYGLKRIKLFKEVITATLQLPGNNPAAFEVQNGDSVEPIGPAESVFPGSLIEIYPAGFLTNDPTFNEAANGPYNRVALTDAVGPIGYATGFKVDTLDASSVVAGNLTGLFYIPKNVVAITVRFTCLDSSPTNLITSVHI